MWADVLCPFNGCVNSILNSTYIVSMNAMTVISGVVMFTRCPCTVNSNLGRVEKLNCVRFSCFRSNRICLFLSKTVDIRLPIRPETVITYLEREVKG